MAEQLPFKQESEGSSPSGPTNEPSYDAYCQAVLEKTLDQLPSSGLVRLLEQITRYPDLVFYGQTATRRLRGGPTQLGPLAAALPDADREKVEDGDEMIEELWWEHGIEVHLNPSFRRKNGRMLSYVEALMHLGENGIRVAIQRVLKSRKKPR